MLKIDLDPIFQARGIDRPYSFLVKAGFTAHSATAILNSSTRNIKINHIELLFKALVCSPNDILSFTADKDQVLANDHPLLKLQHQENTQNFRQSLATIPFDQLKEITKEIAKNK